MQSCRAGANCKSRAGVSIARTFHLNDALDSHRALANSCNNWFAASAGRISAQGLRQALLRTLQQVFHEGAPASTLREEWQTARAYFPLGSLLRRASDNHDQQRAIVLFGEAGARAASVLNFCLDGIPFLYNGQEIGDTVVTDH